MAAHVGQPDVYEDDGVVRIQVGAQKVERFLAGAGEMQCELLAPHLAAKSLTEKLDDIGFVVDHEYGDRHALRPSAGAAATPDCWRGNVMMNSLYWPSFESTVNCPLCCRTTIS